MTDVDMAMSGTITFGLLVFLIDCLNGQNIPTHPGPVMSKAKGRTALIACDVEPSTLQSSALHWYRVQPGGAFQRLMYFEAGSKTAKIDPAVVRTVPYVGSVRNNQVSLTISKLQSEDAGTYYCALWTGDRKVFGSGTRLYVTDSNKDSVKAPILTGYLPLKKSSDKQTMLCQATGMFPDLVKFIWAKKSSTDKWDLISEDNVVEQRNDGAEVTVTSMMIVDKNKAEDGLYKCTVIHEGGNNNPNFVELKKENKDSAKNSPVTVPNPTCPPMNESIEEISDTSEPMRRLYPFVYAYGVMLMKNGVYFCAVSIFLLKRKFGKEEESS